MATSMERYQVEYAEKWRDYVKQIPAIQFPADCKVKVIPPFGGAMARFLVSKNNKEVSVYLDCNDALGIMGAPYYEIHPDKDDDCSRFWLDEAEQMMQAINEVLNEPT
jgi:hypothetical protein